MTNPVSLSIDGREVSVERGVTLIEAAEAAGVHIPNLCHLRGMKGVGACRLCVVEIDGSDVPATACTTKVKEGMIVATDTERVREIRRFVLDLILSMHPPDCMTCAKAGVCNLQRYAYDLDLGDSSFTRKTPGHAVEEANPFVRRDPDYCILCGRCVRVCGSQGTEVLRFHGRGLGSKVVSGTGSPLEESDCTFCGNCVDACPVGALLQVEVAKRGREWQHTKTRTACLACGSACDLVVSTNDGQVVKVGSAATAGDEARFICAIGRFGFEGQRGHMRVSRPLKRVGGELLETSWDDALSLVAERMLAAAGEAGIIAGGSLLNEDALQLKKFADGVLRTKDYDTTVSLYADSGVMLTPGGDLDAADLIVLVGLSPDQWTRVFPALDAAIRDRVSSRKAKLLVVHGGDPRIKTAASIVLAGDEVGSLEQLCRAVIDKGLAAPPEMVEALAHVTPSADARNAADLFAAADAPLILAPAALYVAAANLALLKGGAAAIPFEANARGIARAGLEGEGKGFQELVQGPSPVLYAIGDLPLDSRPDTGFLVVQSAFMTELAGLADVVLPAAAGLESDGSLIDALGRVKHVRRACEPAGEARQHGEIFSALAEAMGVSLSEVESPGGRFVEEGAPGFARFVRRSEWDIDPATLIDTLRRSVVEGSRLAWLAQLQRTDAA